MPKVIKWAAREKRRQVGEAVGRNFLKTLTEPLTNADSILKKQAGIAHATGLVDEMMRLKEGDQIDTASLKAKIKQAGPRRIQIEIITAGAKNRLCRVIDDGIGMTAQELEQKFSTYAEAKAAGERTRSLFGRGALDVLLYHEGSTIFSVRDGILSKCSIYWDQDAMCDVNILGSATKKLLRKHNLPVEILNHGTVVQFKLKEGTRIPQEEQIISRVSNFYMLRLIAADPNTIVELKRIRADGEHTGVLQYDFPIGEVICRADDFLHVPGYEKLSVNILVARSEAILEADPAQTDRRENGLLFVDDNDAVLDLTLLPDHDRNPYLRHIYGIVRISGLRDVLEAKLEADEAEAVLTETREGFDHKHEITKQLFELVDRHVKPAYQVEEKRQKTGDSKRSKALDQRINDALKAINEFNANETDEEGDDDRPPEPRTEPIYFSVDSLRLYAGAIRRVSVFINSEKVNDGEVVLFESDRTEIKVEPESTTAKHSKKQTHQKIILTILCDVKGQKGRVQALSLDKHGKEIRAELRILGVDDQPVFESPEDIAFVAPRYSGDPNRATNNAALLVNLNQFAGLPNVKFWLEEITGKVTLGDAGEKLEVKVTTSHKIADHNVARLVVPFGATGWGQHAVLRAEAKRKDGKFAQAKCKLKFERSQGDQKFKDFLYEDLDRPVLGDVAGDKIYVNSGYDLHRQIFGDTEEEFNKRLETDSMAQVRAVSVLVETAVFHTATTKHHAGGKKGLHIDPDDPIGSLRPYIDESKMKLEPKLYQALVK
jgi:hypothetical protein